MLYPAIGTGFSAGLDRLRKLDGVDVLVDGDAGDADGTRPVGPSLLRTTVPVLLSHPDSLFDECFGPVSVVVEYQDPDELRAAAEAMPGSLTATVHAEDGDRDAVRPLVDLLATRAGRVIWNGWPTGVAVTWAMQHGGPFPSTVGSVHTSVGATAARRFQRPVCFQNTPQAMLPEPLRDANRLGIERRVDGQVTHGDVSSP
jgi:NADP-dependent aldehyde dehydrogenase